MLADGVDDDRPDEAVFGGEPLVAELPEQPAAQRLLGLGQRVRAPCGVLPDGSSSPSLVLAREVVAHPFLILARKAVIHPFFVLARQLFVHFEHAVRFEELPQLAPELERRELEQTYRLTHPRRDRELLSGLELRGRLHRGGRGPSER